MKTTITNGLKGQRFVYYRHGIANECEVLKPFHKNRFYAVWNITLDKQENVKTSDILKCEKWC